jgi:hypothetical protein
MADQEKAKEPNSPQDRIAAIGGAGASAAAQPASTATEQVSEPTGKEFGDLALDYFNRRLKAHPHPTIKLELREVDVLEVMPDGRLKVAPQGKRNEDSFVALNDALMDQLLARLIS